MPRKLIEFHKEDMRALEELADDRSASLQELMDEAVRDLLVKHRKFTNLRSALKESGASGRKRPANDR
jgi:hypothetical protein